MCCHKAMYMYTNQKTTLTLASFQGSCTRAWEQVALTCDNYMYHFAGGLCSCCQSSGPTADEYETYLTRALEEIRQNVSRVFVNLVPIANLSQVNLNAAVCTKWQTKYNLLFILAIYRSYTGLLNSQNTV